MIPAPAQVRPGRNCCLGSRGELGKQEQKADGVGAGETDTDQTLGSIFSSGAAVAEGVDVLTQESVAKGPLGNGKNHAPKGGDRRAFGTFGEEPF